LPAAELVVNELIGNVARHTPGPAKLVLEWQDDSAIVRVCDGGKPFTPPAQSEPVELFSEDGRGLFLVRTVARELRVEWTGEGNCVSAVLPVNGPVSPGVVTPSGVEGRTVTRS
jgi:anti-sigma regulatory factor (Ser/Thr protein kinase)